jgi:hypothetical protein
VSDEIPIPSSRPYCLDTSALMALVEKEPGMERVKELLARENVLVPCTVLLETYYTHCFALFEVQDQLVGWPLSPGEMHPAAPVLLGHSPVWLPIGW